MGWSIGWDHTPPPSSRKRSPIPLQVWHDKDPSLPKGRKPKHRPWFCRPFIGQLWRLHMSGLFSSETWNNSQTNLIFGCFILYGQFTKWNGVQCSLKWAFFIAMFKRFVQNKIYMCKDWVDLGLYACKNLGLSNISLYKEQFSKRLHD